MPRGLAFCRELVRYCGALAPLQGALLGVASTLGHRSAQPQAVLSVPVGDARVRWVGVFQEVWSFVVLAEWRAPTDLGHRGAQPQAVLSVPVGDARVRWRRACSKRSGHLSSLRNGAPLQTWGIAVLSPRLSSRSPSGTRGFGDGATVMGRPYRAGGIGVSVTWADGPGWYGARRWRWGASVSIGQLLRPFRAP